MYYFLLTLLILDAVLLMTVVLLQAGKGGGLAAMGGGGGDTLLGGRQAATLLTRATWWTGGIFLTLSLVLSMMSRAPGAGDPLLRGQFQGPGAPVAAPGVVPGPADQTSPSGGQLTPGQPSSAVNPGEPAAPPATPGQ